MATWQVYYLPSAYMAVVLPVLWLHGRCITCQMTTLPLYYLPYSYMAVVFPAYGYMAVVLSAQ